MANKIVAIDLGSNSFHLAIAQIEQGEIKIINRMAEKIQLSKNLSKDGKFSKNDIERGLECLRKFAQILPNKDDCVIRVVGTSALRESQNSDEFTIPAERILEVPVEIIAGREEARLIFLGVNHYLPLSDKSRLVIDIGGGSTEFIVGSNFEPTFRESLTMGCVSYNSQFFTNKKFDLSNFDKAYVAARIEISNILKVISREKWDQVIGSSGTIKSVFHILQLEQKVENGINYSSVLSLKDRLMKIEDFNRFDLPGLKSDRKNVFAAGLTILIAAFDALGINQMQYSDGALREGVLYDLVGRNTQEDVRQRSIEALIDRYHIKKDVSVNVGDLALVAFHQVKEEWKLNIEDKNFLYQAALLHQIGMSISHSKYHKHGEYIILNSDIAGFSTLEQKYLAVLVRYHRRDLNKLNFNSFGKMGNKLKKMLVLLRYAVLMNKVNDDNLVLNLKASSNGLNINFINKDIDKYPLTKADFKQEAEYLKEINFKLAINES